LWAYKYAVAAAVSVRAELIELCLSSRAPCRVHEGQATNLIHQEEALNMRTVRVLAASVLVLVAVVAAGPGPAAASPPDRQLITIDTTGPAPGLTRVCEFPVTRHDVGTIRVHSFYRNGELVRLVENYNIATDWTAYGHTISGRTGGVDVTAYNPDGSYSLMIGGPTDHITIPGYGYILGLVGNMLVEVDSAGNETITRDVGHPQYLLENYQTVCAALAP
jgi:hypothetical protein